MLGLTYYTKILTFLHHLTMVPSVMVGDSDGILTSVPGVEPPDGWPEDSSAESVDLATSAASAGDSAEADDPTVFQSSPSSAKTAIGVPT